MLSMLWATYAYKYSTWLNPKPWDPLTIVFGRRPLPMAEKKKKPKSSSKNAAKARCEGYLRSLKGGKKKKSK